MSVLFGASLSEPHIDCIYDSRPNAGIYPSPAFVYPGSRDLCMFWKYFMYSVRQWLHQIKQVKKDFKENNSNVRMAMV